MTSPTQRSLALLRKEGARPWVVEKWNPYAGIRQDLYGFIDIVALEPGKQGLLGVQCTTGQNLPARVKKAIALEDFKMWKECGNRIEFHGWSLKGKRGKRKTWQVTRLTGEGDTNAACEHEQRPQQDDNKPILSPSLSQ